MQKSKKKWGILGGTGLIAVALSVVISMVGNEISLEGKYNVHEVTEFSNIVTVDAINDLKDATFYEIYFNEESIGKTVFGDNFGITVASILMNPIERLSVVVYNYNQEPIAYGKFTDNERILFKIKESESNHEN